MDPQTEATDAIRLVDTLVAQYLSSIQSLTTKHADQFSVEIAEVDRIYPAIWQHLDRAREATWSAGRNATTRLVAGSQGAK